jgi:hypothetical protein
MSLALLLAAGFGFSGSAWAAPANDGLLSRLSRPSLVTPAQYCPCGRVCYARDYYGRCISWRCKACAPKYVPPYAPPYVPPPYRY